MANYGKNSVDKTWRSFDAGILDVIIGLIITGSGIIFPLAIWEFGTFATLGKTTSASLAIIAGIILLGIGLFTMYGGEMAMKRRRWGLALAASICASLVIFGLVALVLIIVSRDEFTTKSSAENNHGAKQPHKKN
jgi:hypothetical protein